jgi:hypothetical protein
MCFTVMNIVYLLNILYRAWWSRRISSLTFIKSVSGTFFSQFFGTLFFPPVLLHLSKLFCAQSLSKRYVSIESFREVP